MNAQTTTEAAANKIATLEVGMMLQIPGRKQPVCVVSVTTIGGEPYAFLSSGRVRPGHMANGTLFASKWSEGKFVWQPTIQQKAVTIDGFEVIGFAN